eukprot:m.203367 g.203367  ORF g.203367 m.203367 type:complete len:1140 (+) comp15761_c0_seq13:321-3740(+)
MVCPCKLSDYFESEEKEKAKGVIPVTDMKQVNPNDFLYTCYIWAMLLQVANGTGSKSIKLSDNKHPFHFNTTEGITYIFYADSEKEQTLWVNALDQEIDISQMLEELEAAKQESQGRPWLSDTTGWISVTVESASNLRPADISLFKPRSSDPYVKVIYGSQNVVRTTTKNNQLSPNWNETTMFLVRTIEAVDYPDAKLHFDVYDEDVATKDDFLGSCDLSLDHFTFRAALPPDIDALLGVSQNGLPGDQMTLELRNSTKKQKAQGVLSVSVAALSFSSDSFSENESQREPHEDDIFWRSCTKQFNAVRRSSLSRRHAILAILRKRLLTAYAHRARRWRGVNSVYGTSRPANPTIPCHLCGEETNATKRDSLCSLCGGVFCKRCNNGWGWAGVINNTKEKGKGYTTIRPLSKENDAWGAATFRTCHPCDAWMRCWTSAPSGEGDVFDMNAVRQIRAAPSKREAMDSILAKFWETKAEAINEKLDWVLTQTEACEQEVQRLLVASDRAKAAVQAVKELKDAVSQKYHSVLDKVTSAGNELRAIDGLNRDEQSVRANILLQLRNKSETITKNLLRITIQNRWLAELAEVDASIGTRARAVRSSAVMKGVLLVTVKSVQGVASKNSCVVFEGSGSHVKKQTVHVHRHRAPTSADINSVVPVDTQVAVPVFSPAKETLNISMETRESKHFQTLRLIKSEFEDDEEQKLTCIFPNRKDMHESLHDDKAVNVQVQLSPTISILLICRFQPLGLPPQLLESGVSNNSSDTIVFTGTDVKPEDSLKPKATGDTKGPGVLFVCVERADGLKISDKDGSSDPYCVVYAKHGLKRSKKKHLIYRTRSCKHNLAPVWNDNVYVVDNPNDAWCGEILLQSYSSMSLEFIVRDHDSTTLDDRIGLGTMDLDKILASQEKQQKLGAEFPRIHSVSLGKGCGNVYVSVLFRRVLVDEHTFQIGDDSLVVANISKRNARKSATGLQLQTQEIQEDGSMPPRPGTRRKRGLFGCCTGDAEESSNALDRPMGVFGKLTVTVHGARGLSENDRITSLGAIYRNHSCVSKTKAVKGSNPEWNDVAISLDITDSLRDEIWVEVRVQGLLGSSVLGRARLHYTDIHQNLTREWMSLGEDSRHSRGNVCVSVSFDLYENTPVHN